MKFVRTIRDAEVDEPSPDWPRNKSGRFGEDLVGGWLLENGGQVEGLESGKSVNIPVEGNSAKRRTDWLVGKRIIVEVKTYNSVLGQGDYGKNTHQIEDLALWREQRPDERAVVLARVALNGKSSIDRAFEADVRHFNIPMVLFLRTT